MYIHTYICICKVIHIYVLSFCVFACVRVDGRGRGQSNHREIWHRRSRDHTAAADWCRVQRCGVCLYKCHFCGYVGVLAVMHCSFAICENLRITQPQQMDTVHIPRSRVSIYKCKYIHIHLCAYGGLVCGLVRFFCRNWRSKHHKAATYRQEPIFAYIQGCFADKNRN